jgi:hypothetical protein
MDEKIPKSQPDPQQQERADLPDSLPRAQPPDPDQTNPATLSAPQDEIELPLEDGRFTSEHSIGPDHAEPTTETGMTNDNYIDGEYIDVGGGD